MAKKNAEDDYDPNQDDDYSEGSELNLDAEAEKKSKKKRKDSKKRKRDSKKASKKKKKKNDDDAGIEFDAPPVSSSATTASTTNIAESHVEDEFDSIMEQAKVTGGKTASREARDKLQKTTDESSRMLVERMREAAHHDEEMLSKGKGPALNKLRMCDEVKKACSKRMMQNTLIGDGLLEVFTLWLTRQGQLSELPLLHIRTTILDILLDLPLATDNVSDEFADYGISVDDLRQSGIGKFVKYLAKHPNETRSNKDKAYRIIQKWTRLIHRLTDDYSSLSLLESSDETSQNRMRQPVEQVHRITDQQDSEFSTRARVPRKMGFDFIKRPESKVDPSKVPQQLRPMQRRK